MCLSYTWNYLHVNINHQHSLCIKAMEQKKINDVFDSR